MSTILQTAAPQGALRRRVIAIYAVLAVFNIGVFAWLASFVIYRANDYDSLEVRPAKR